MQTAPGMAPQAKKRPQRKLATTAPGCCMSEAMEAFLTHPSLQQTGLPSYGCVHTERVGDWRSPPQPDKVERPTRLRKALYSLIGPLWSQGCSTIARCNCILSRYGTERANTVLWSCRYQEIFTNRLLVQHFGSLRRI